MGHHPYPCHPACGRKYRAQFGPRWPKRFKRSHCKRCGKLWRFTLSPNGLVVELEAKKK